MVHILYKTLILSILSKNGLSLFKSANYGNNDGYHVLGKPCRVGPILDCINTKINGKSFLTWTCHTEENIILPDTCHRRLMKLLNCLNYFHNLLRGCMMYNVQTKIWVIHFGFHDTLSFWYSNLCMLQLRGYFLLSSFPFILSSFLIPSSAHKSIKGNVMTYHMWNDTL